MSIDDNFDPEANIHLYYFPEITRILDHKEVIVRYMKRNSSALPKALVI